MTHRVTWRGHEFDARTRDMLVEVDRLAGTIPIRPTQGSYSTSVGASAGTHAGGGAVDLHVVGFDPAVIVEIVKLLWTVGFVAAHRLPSEGPWPEHVHGIAVGCPDLSPVAAHQVEEFRRGENGLANHATFHQSHPPMTTWEHYLAARDAAKHNGATTGSTFPGSGAFVIGKSHPAVTLLGRMLVAAGFAKHRAGAKYTPGPVFTEYDRLNCLDFQRTIWPKATSGIPGPQTWAHLVKASHL